MIAMSHSAKSFGTLADYLANGRSGDEPDRVAWSASRNLLTADPELAGKIMRATAAQNVRVKDPVYHLTLSFDPGDAVDRAAMEHVVDRVIAALDLHGHQVLIVSHRDRGHPHMHLLINRVHPETGRVWNRWQDRAIIQEVLREEERALGLRAVPGRLPSRAQLGLELSEVPRQEATKSRAVEPDAQGCTDSHVPPRKQSRIEELTAHLRSYERIAELTREEYAVGLEVGAANARSAQFEDALRRVDSTRDAFARALGDMYRNPLAAQQIFSEVAERQGLDAATRLMRERPEQFGTLLTVETPRAFGLGRSSDESVARRAAPHAALKGQDALNAEQVAARLVERSTSPQATRHSETNDIPVVEKGLTVPVGQSKVTTPAIRMNAALATARSDIEQITGRALAIRHELRTMPDRGDLERRIVDLLDRMSPRELRQLRTALATPQVAVVLKLKAALRDVLLGREEAHQR
jgi:relaxase-like protein